MIHQVLSKIQKIDKYTIEYEFMAGGQGQVYLGSFCNMLYAIKIPSRLSKINLSLFNRQNKFLSLLSHPNIVSFIEYKQNAEIICQDKTSFLCPMTVMEFVQEGDLFDITQRKMFSQSICRTLIGELVQALKYTHYQKRIMHLDIKLENVLLDKFFNLKITDFGHARFYQQMEIKPQKFVYGTNHFQPPQVNQFQLFSGEKVDVFNLGLILIRLATSTYPITKTTIIRNDNLYKKIGIQKTCQFWKHFQKIPNLSLSNGIKRLILCMIHPNPQKRYTLQQITQDDWYITTKQATQQQVRLEFLKQKQRLMDDPKQGKKRLQDIRDFYDKLNNTSQHQNQHQHINQGIQAQQQNIENQDTYRNSKIAVFDEFYHDLLRDKKVFSNITQKCKYKVIYTQHQPSFIVSYLKKKLKQLFQINIVLVDNIFKMFIPVEYTLQLINKTQGLIKIKFQYQCSQNQQTSNQNSKFCEEKSDQSNQSDNQQSDNQQSKQHINVYLYGQILKNNGRFGIDWDLHQRNQTDCWTKETINQLKRICYQLWGDSKAKQNKSQMQ